MYFSVSMITNFNIRDVILSIVKKETQTAFFLTFFLNKSRIRKLEAFKTYISLSI